MVPGSAVAAFTLSSRSLGAKGPRLGWRGSGWAASNLRVVPAPTSCAASYRCSLHVSRQAGRVAGVACQGLMKVAEGLLDAGLEVVSTLGAVLDCWGWSDRLLCQPCPGLVGDRAGLVALGAVEAIIGGWMLGVGHGDILGRGQNGRPGRRRGPRERSRRRPGPLYPLPPAGGNQPAGAVTSGEISPGIYGERCTAVAAGRLASEADGD